MTHILKTMPVLSCHSLDEILLDGGVCVRDGICWNSLHRSRFSLTLQIYDNINDIFRFINSLMMEKNQRWARLDAECEYKI